MSFSQSEYDNFYYPYRLKLNKIKIGDTVWFLEKQDPYVGGFHTYVIHEAKYKNRYTRNRDFYPWYSYPVFEFEFYDNRQMCYRNYCKEEDDLNKQPQYDGRFFDSFEEAEKCRIEAESLYIQEVLKDCYNAIQLSKKAYQKIEHLFKCKGIFDESMFSACEKYFDSTEYNSGSVLYNLGHTIKNKLKENSKK